MDRIQVRLPYIVLCIFNSDKDGDGIALSFNLNGGITPFIIPAIPVAPDNSGGLVISASGRVNPNPFEDFIMDRRWIGPLVIVYNAALKSIFFPRLGGHGL